MSEPKQWNPYFVEYARVHKHTPEFILEHKDEAWRADKMLGFGLWIRQAWRAWRQANGIPERVNGFKYILSDEQRADFGVWLKSYSEKVS